MTPFEAAIEGDARDRPRGPGDHALADRRLPAGRLHGRHRRPLHELLRADDGVRDPRLALRQLHAHADAVRALAEAGASVGVEVGQESDDVSRRTPDRRDPTSTLTRSTWRHGDLASTRFYRPHRARLHVAARLAMGRRWVVVAGCVRWSLFSIGPAAAGGAEELPAGGRRVAVRGHACARPRGRAWRRRSRSSTASRSGRGRSTACATRWSRSAATRSGRQNLGAIYVRLRGRRASGSATSTR